MEPHRTEPPLSCPTLYCLSRTVQGQGTVQCQGRQGKGEEGLATLVVGLIGGERNGAIAR